MNNIKIGLANGLNYLDYQDLVTVFLDELHIPYLVSNKTTKKTLEDGKSLVVDESCLALKLYFGHLVELKDKCDYLLVIRSPSIRKKEMLCTNFYALYDLANNLFPNKVIELNIDACNNIDLKDAFINLGKRLGYSKKKSQLAFNKAYEFYLNEKEKKYENNIKLFRSKKKKIMLVGHNYNLFNDYICGDVKKILKDNEIETILSSSLEIINSDRYKMISKDIYWSKNKDILNVIANFKNYVDGFILISVFPCGPDSLVNEMIIRKVNKPILNLVIDELNDIGGITTRVESFIDILKMEEKNYECKN